MSDQYDYGTPQPPHLRLPAPISKRLRARADMSLDGLIEDALRQAEAWEKRAEEYQAMKVAAMKRGSGRGYQP